jgi:cysteine desulfurase
MIYLDNAGTTQVIPECVRIFEKYQTEDFFNPSALYHQSLELSRKLKEAREDVMRELKCGDGRFIFTSSGSESDNTVLFGARKPNGSRIIVSASEHPAVLNAAMELKQKGYDVVLCDVDRNGRVIEDKFAEYMTAETSLVSVMHVNNETGCVNDIKKLCETAKKINPNVIFHSDGVQAVGKIKVNIADTGVDAYSVSGHKIHAPKGVAGLFIAKNASIRPLIYGGGQEFGMRSSTENVGGILAFSEAVKQAVTAQKENEIRITAMRADLAENLEKFGFCVSEASMQSPYILCAAMKSVRGEVMLHSLEKYGILIGTGSACSSKKGPKRLASILKLTPEYENGIIRVSFSRFTTNDDIEYFKKSIKTEYEALFKYIQ